MRLRKTLSVTVVALAFFVAAVAAAKPKDSRNVILHSDAMVAGSHLASGNYTVQWETHSPEATVTFMQGRKVAATVPGKVVDRGKKYWSDEVVYYETDNGALRILELRFEGSSEVLEFTK